MKCGTLWPAITPGEPGPPDDILRVHECKGDHPRPGVHLCWWCGCTNDERGPCDAQDAH